MLTISAPAFFNMSMATLRVFVIFGSIWSEKYSFGSPSLSPFIPFVRFAVKSGVSARSEVASISSWPQMAFRMSAASFTVLEQGPIWSRDEANATSPYRDTLPYDGLRPMMPQ